MPRGDGTGPAGFGPMTGRAAGYCAGYSVPGYLNPVPGRGLGFGRGRGFGRGLGLGFRGGRGWGGYWGAPYAAPVYPWSAAVPAYGASFGAVPDREQESGMLKSQVKYLEQALEGVRSRITELEAEAGEKK